MIDPGPDARNIDPTTRALEAYIDASVEQLLQGNTGTPQNGLLFLSAWHEAMPALVHLDPVLDPVDSRVFAVLWIWAKQQGRGSTAFPAYDYLLKRANIHSRATVARSLAILRITRWVTLCRRVRDQGRNRGNIYALHDEPLALASTLYLDPGYMEFLQNAQRHHHDHVGKIARALLQSLRECIDEGEDVLAASPLSQADQRLEALATIAGQGSGHYFWLRQGALNAEGALNSDRVQKLNSVAPVHNLNSAVCSSRYLYKKTTTTTTDAGSSARAREEPVAEPSLVYPESLSRNEQLLSGLYLKGFEPEMRQSLLDELAEKIVSQKKTERRVRNPIGLLAWMCKEARAGRPPLTSAYLKRRECRAREEALRQQDEAEKRRLTEMALRQGV